jgi:hypothetical protein
VRVKIICLVARIKFSHRSTTIVDKRDSYHEMKVAVFPSSYPNERVAAIPSYAEFLEGTSHNIEATTDGGAYAFLCSIWLLA